MKRLAAALVLTIALTGCGATGAPNNSTTNTNPFKGWVKIDDYVSYRCLGSDKVVKNEGHGKMDIETVRNSEDCQR